VQSAAACEADIAASANVYHNSRRPYLFQLRAIGVFLWRIAGLTTIVYGAFTHRS
jgi:hypothetical protein